MWQPIQRHGPIPTVFTLEKPLPRLGQPDAVPLFLAKVPLTQRDIFARSRHHHSRLQRPGIQQLLFQPSLFSNCANHSLF